MRVVSADEVHAVYRVPLTELRDPTHRITVHGPAGWRSPGFLIGDDNDVICWGFTAGVIARLFEYLGWIEDLPDAPAQELPDYMLVGRRAGDPRRPRRPPDAQHRLRAAPRVNLLDWLLVVLVGAYALSGYWQGFVTGAFATSGLLLGGLLGVWLAPIALGDADPSLLVSLGALFIVILSASLGQALFQYVGARIRDQITWQPARALDAVGGAALSAVAVLIVAWALGVAISGSRIGGITRMVRSSAGAREGQRGDAGRGRRPAATRSTTWSARRSSRATSSRSRPSASSRSAPATSGSLPDPDVRPCRGERAQDPRHQRLRPRRRGVRLPLRRRTG